MATRNDLANAIRALAMDAVQKANSGHPGAPMGMAEIAEVLWNHHLRHNPANPKWPDRDRFVLSNGHGSMLIYALLHLTGYDVSIDDLKGFRQLHSRTPGHPEYGYTPGVETTTGPLGQGITNAVGMALSEKLLAHEFNKPGLDIVNHHTYVFMGDGCMMEGISHEACALAGTWKLNKLIAFWDDNGISIDGHTEGWFTDDTPKRFEAYGWNVIAGVDGHDAAAVEAAVQKAKQSADQPTLICCKTIIGKGSPNKEGTHDVHGAALGAAEIAATRANLGWNHDPFVIPQDIYDGWNAKTKGEGVEKLWSNKFAEYAAQFPELAAEFTRRMNGDLPADWNGRVQAALATTLEKAENVATRKSSQLAIERLVSTLPERVGGSADLTGSNLTNWPGCHSLHRNPGGNYISYGVREFGAARRHLPVRRHLPDVLGIRPQRPAHGRPDEAARGLGVYPRFHRPGRRRPDSPAGRADRHAAHDSQHDCLAPLRQHRDPGGLGGQRRKAGRPELPHFEPPEPALRQAQRRADRRHPPRRLCDFRLRR